MRSWWELLWWDSCPYKRELRVLPPRFCLVRTGVKTATYEPGCRSSPDTPLSPELWEVIICHLQAPQPLQFHSSRDRLTRCMKVGLRKEMSCQVVVGPSSPCEVLWVIGNEGRRGAKRLGRGCACACARREGGKLQWSCNHPGKNGEVLNYEWAPPPGPRRSLGRKHRSKVLEKFIVKPWRA